MCRDFTSADLIKTILCLAIAFEKKYIEKFVTIRIVDILKVIVGLDFLTGMGIQSYYRYIRVTKMVLRLESVLDPEES